MSINVRPINDNILVKRLDSEKVTLGGIHIPDNRQTKNRYCEVVAVGPGRYKKDSSERMHIGLEVGQVVYIRGTAGREVELNGEKGFLFVESIDVEAIVEGYTP